jgi:hypothetical protein
VSVTAHDSLGRFGRTATENAIGPNCGRTTTPDPSAAACSITKAQSNGSFRQKRPGDAHLATLNPTSVVPARR